MRYVIMANGKGIRWNNYGGTPKSLIEINGETLLARTSRLVRQENPNAEVIITSHDERCSVPGVKRHVPLQDTYEIDRFTNELIDCDICFLYGDTFYTESAIKTIVSTPVEDNLLFFGDGKTIFAVKSNNPELMKWHVDRVRDLFKVGKIKGCKGWQLYQSFVGLPFDVPLIGSHFVKIFDKTGDFNYPEDYLRFVSQNEPKQAMKNKDNESEKSFICSSKK